MRNIPTLAAGTSAHTTLVFSFFFILMSLSLEFSIYFLPLHFVRWSAKAFFFLPPFTIPLIFCFVLSFNVFAATRAKKVATRKVNQIIAACKPSLFSI